MDNHFLLAVFRNSSGRVIEKPEGVPIHWRPSAYAAITSPDHPGCVLMVRPSGDEELWQIPGGGVEVHEGLLQGLRRELQEETGYDAVQIHTEDVAIYEEAFYWRSKDQFYHAVLFIFAAQVAAGAPEKMRTGDPIDGHEIHEQRWMSLAEINEQSVHRVHREHITKMKKRLQG